ncbi:unnamed protein product [Paramecium octaurelia]|uniref:Uncharacterized protein n=1 Tax=Paramecium octaurelia TaxID=43137 RepID=A0A8S1YP19_PAROT|nr:unnamed protein product [Paramecium octaurelia]
MERKQNKIEQEQKSKTTKILVSLQYEVEGSFNRIHAQLDQLLNDEFNFINILPSQASSDLPKLNSNPQLKFKNDDFPQQGIKHVIQLIKINSQVQQKHNEQVNQPFTKKLIQQNSIKQNEPCQAIPKLIEKFAQAPQAQNSPNFTFSSFLKSPSIKISEQKNILQTDYLFANHDTRFILIEPGILKSCS